MSKPTFFEPPKYNLIGRNQLWIDSCIHAHDTWCGCSYPIAHFIDSVVPVGHKDRDLTINEILSRDLTAKCHFGGAAETNGGVAPALDTAARENTEEEDLEKLFSEDAIEELLEAAANDERPR